MKHTKSDDTKTAMRVSVITLVINIVLSLLKFIAGIFAGSAAMVSDALHSASDVLSTFVVIIGVRLSAKDADLEHPFGHERLECIAAIVLAAMLFAAGAGIGYSGLNSIIDGSYRDKGAPGVLALLAAVLSIAVKEWMFWYTRAAAKKNPHDCTARRRLASPLGRPLIGWRPARHRRGETRISGIRPGSVYHNLPVHTQGGGRHFP